MNEYSVNFPIEGKTFTFSTPKEVMALLNKTKEPFLIKYKGETLLYVEFLNHFTKGIRP